MVIGAAITGFLGLTSPNFVVAVDLRTSISFSNYFTLLFDLFNSFSNNIIFDLSSSSSFVFVYVSKFKDVVCIFEGILPREENTLRRARF